MKADRIYSIENGSWYEIHGQLSGQDFIIGGGLMRPRVCPICGASVTVSVCGDTFSASACQHLVARYGKYPDGLGDFTSPRDWQGDENHPWAWNGGWHVSSVFLADGAVVKTTYPLPHGGIGYKHFRVENGGVVPWPEKD